MVDSEPPPFRYQPRPARSVALVVATCLVVGGGVLGGYGVGCTVIDGYGDGPATYVAGDAVGIQCVVGVGLAVIGILTWSLVVGRFRRDLSGWHGTGALLLAGAVGLLLAAWELGVRAPYDVIAFAMAAAGLGAVVLGSLAASRRQRRWAHERRLIAEGVAVPGRVVDPGLEPGDYDEASNVVTTASFRFVGADGRTFLVHRRVTVPQDVAVVEGQRTTIWYDPTDPLDDRSVVVALVHALEWNVAVPVDGEGPQRQASASV